MEPVQLQRALRGVLAFSPTLFAADGSVDLEGQRRHVDFLADSGVNAIVVTGGVGEFYALEEGEFVDLVRAAVDAAGGRVPVLAGVGNSTAIASRLAAAAGAAGVDGIMVNPLYFVRPDVEGMRAHYRDVGAACGLGLVIFSTVGSVYNEDVLEQLAEVPEAIAVKDEVGNVELFERCVRGLGERFAWINGMAELPAVEYAERGAQAMTTGLANLDPQLTLDVWQAACAGDRERHGQLVRERIAFLADLRSARPGYHITVLKEAMEILGRGSARVRLPLVPLRPEERAALAAHLEQAGFPAAGLATSLS